MHSDGHPPPAGQLQWVSPTETENEIPHFILLARYYELQTFVIQIGVQGERSKAYGHFTSYRPTSGHTTY